MTDVTTILPADDGETLHVAEDRIRVLAYGEAEPAELFEVSGPRGSGPPPHRHAWSEAYFVLRGELDVTIDGGTRRLHTGDYLRMPAHALHTYPFASEQAAFLAMTAPHGALAFFRALHQAVQGEAPGALERMMAACADHGVRIEAPELPR